METENKISWAQIIPLIGGLPIGMRNIFNCNPKYVLSFKGFENNDMHFINYLRKNHDWTGKYIQIDPSFEPMIHNRKFDNCLKIDLDPKYIELKTKNQQFNEIINSDEYKKYI